MKKLNLPKLYCKQWRLQVGGRVAKGTNTPSGKFFEAAKDLTFVKKIHDFLIFTPFLYC